MKKVKVSELKARLSSYLAEVRGGDTVTVCERATPIARLVPFESDPGVFRIREPQKALSEFEPIRPVHLRRKVNIQKILRETRGER